MRSQGCWAEQGITINSLCLAAMSGAQLTAAPLLSENSGQKWIKYLRNWVTRCWEQVWDLIMAEIMMACVDNNVPCHTCRWWLSRSEANYLNICHWAQLSLVSIIRHQNDLPPLWIWNIGIVRTPVQDSTKKSESPSPWTQILFS